MNDSSDDDDQSYSELFAMLDRAVLEQSSTSRQVMLDQDDAEDPCDVADATQVARSPYDCDRSMSSKTSFASMDKMDALEHSPCHVDVLSKDIQGDKDIPKAMQWQKQQHQYQKGPSQDKSPDFSAAKDSDASVGTSSSSSETSNHSSPMGDGIGAQRGTLETSCIAGDQDVALELAEERDYSKDTVFDKADDACSATSGSSSTTSSSNSSSSLSASSSTTSSESKCNEKEEHDPYPFTAKLPITKDTKPTISNPYSKKTTTKTPTAVQEEIDSADDKAKAPMKRSGFFMAEDSDSDESSISMDGIRQNKTTTDGSPSKDSPLKEKFDDASLFSDDGTASSAAAAAVPTLRPEVTETPPREVQDYRPNINDPEPEIDPKLYAPPAYRPRRRPVLKQYNLQSHPLHARRSIAVTNLFSPPMDKLWTNKFQEFNHFQSEMARWMCDTDDNVVVSAPTGAGKSTIFEIAMARFLTMDLVSQGATASSHQSHVLSKARKMVYIAPSKALCEERYEDWSRRFQALQLGIEVAMITGDSADPGLSFGDLTSAHLIISTPEKWDSMTRRWQENFYLMASVKLLLVDEVHLLGDKDRGWCLEALVCRMKTIHRAAKAVAVDSNELRRSSYPATNPDAIKTPFRMVAVSATLPNIAEVADFFHANEAYSFDESYRPIPLAKHIMAMGSRGKNEWKFWNNLDQHVPDVIRRFSCGKQSLIFCHTKKETLKIAELLIQRRAFGNRNVRTTAEKGTIQYFVEHGIGYHHAGLEKEDRQTIEQAFSDGKIKCLACTSTLATGVNLPAHLVLVVGSRAWRGKEGGYKDIETSQLLQMIGRAGRPGLDSSGTAVILTDKESRNSLHRQLNEGLGPARSQLLLRLPEVLNAEISSLVVQTSVDAVRWLQGTFFFSCLSYHEERHPESVTEEICCKTFNQLLELGVIGMSDGVVNPQPGCHIMNKHLLSYDAMKTIASWPSDATQCQILRSISMMKELHEPVRRNEKKELREIHKTEVIKYKLSQALSKFTVQDESQKAFILLQAIISQHEFQNQRLRQEMSELTNRATKILCAAQEYCIQASKFGNVAKHCFLLHRSLMVCLWGVDSGVLNQIDGVGMTCARLLKFKGIFSFQHILQSTEEAIEKAAGRRFPFGRQLKSTVQELIRDNLDLSAKIEYTRGSGRPASIVISLRKPDGSFGVVAAEKGDPTVTFTVIAYTDSGSRSIILAEENVSKATSFRVPLPNGVGKIYVTKLASVVGLDDNIALDAIRAPNNSVPLDAPKIQMNEANSRNDAGYSGGKRKTLQTEIPFTASKKPKNSPPQKVCAPQDPSPTITPNREEVVYVKTTHDASNGRQWNWSQHGDIMRNTNVPPSQNQESSQSELTFQNCCGHPSDVPINITPLTHARRPAMQSFKHIHPQDHRFSKDVSQRSTTSHRQDIPDFWTPSHLQDNAAPSHGVGPSRNMNQQWDKARQSASRAQKRAFTGKKENPFRSFSHDPNDSEGRLKSLSQRRQTFSSKQFKRSKNSHLERRPPRTNQRDFLQQAAEELEGNRQRVQFARCEESYAAPYQANGYPPPSSHCTFPPPEPPVSRGRSLPSNHHLEYALYNAPHFAREPPRDPWYSPNLSQPHDHYATSRGHYGDDYPNANPFASPYENHQPPSPRPAHGHSRQDGNDFFREEFNAQPGRWEERSYAGPPLEIEVPVQTQNKGTSHEQDFHGHGAVSNHATNSPFDNPGNAFESYF